MLSGTCVFIDDFLSKNSHVPIPHTTLASLLMFVMTHTRTSLAKSCFVLLHTDRRLTKNLQCKTLIPYIQPLTVTVKMAPPRLVPPGTNFLKIWTPWNLFHCKLWTPFEKFGPLQVCAGTISLMNMDPLDQTTFVQAAP